MSISQKYKNRENNVKLELISGVFALMVSLIFVFSNHIGNFYQIFYVIYIFIIHQIIQMIFFNRWNFNSEFNSKKLWLRIIIIIFLLIIVFIDLGKIDSHYSYYLGFTNDKRSNTFLSIGIYCAVYFICYLLGLKRINKRKNPEV